jgi:uncharacterized membrane protein YgcG
MSNWEEKLRSIAEGKAWDLPTLDQVKDSLDQLMTILKHVSDDTGLTGSTGLEASSVLADARSDTQSLISYLADDLPEAIEAANKARDTAKTALSQLGAGGLSPEQTAAIRGAEAGATVVVGPIAVVVGEGAIAAANAFFGNQRESEAKAAVETVTQELDAAREKLQDPPSMDIYNTDPGQGPSSGGPAPTIRSGGPSGPSFPQYPDYNVPPGNGGKGYAIVDEAGWVIDNGEPTDIQIPRDPGEPPIIIPTPDGPITGGVTFPDGGSGGGIHGGGSGGGLHGGGLHGGGSGGLGGGVGSGLMAGAGGAAALGGLRRLSGAGASTLARLAGLGGGGIGGGGIGGAGGAGGGLRGGAGATSDAGGGKTGGLLGGRGAAVSGAAAGEGAAGRGGMGMAGGAGGAGGQGAGRSSKQRGRGLGGPLAPRLEDDEEFGPLSENAGAGGRE